MNFLHTLVKSFLAFVVVIFTMAFTADTGSKKAATEWNIDKAHSKISFTVSHFFTPVTGQFQEYTSDIQFDPNNLEESRVNVEIMVNSIDTDNQKRDGHLRSDDFFHAQKFPNITFRSNEIVQTGENTFAARGALTIKDVTRDVELPFTLLGIRDHPMRDGVQLAGIKLDYTLDRNTYNVGVGDWVSDAVVGDEVDITATLELNSANS
ncbi:MAG: YceI family protein [Balneolaceae bacterium]|nr:YceI family protein [Balneolaceae bacterium]